jgi:hypothetical protein
VERWEFTMLDQGQNLVLPGKSPDFLIVVALVTEQNVDIFGVVLNQRWSNLAIVLPRRCHISIENSVYFPID